MKQYILIRTDIKIPIGKIIAHAGHNVLKAWDDIFKTEYDLPYNVWKWYYEQDQTKIVVDGGTETDIWKIITKAKRQEVPYSFVEDIKWKKRICAVIGPVTDKEADFLGLSKLALYKNEQ